MRRRVALVVLAVLGAWLLHAAHEGRERELRHASPRVRDAATLVVRDLRRGALLALVVAAFASTRRRRTPEAAVTDVAALLRDRLPAWERRCAARGVALELEGEHVLRLPGPRAAHAALLQAGFDAALQRSPAGAIVLVQAFGVATRGYVEIVDAGAPPPAALAARLRTGLRAVVSRDAYAQRASVRRLGGTLRLHPGPQSRGRVWCYSQPCVPTAADERPYQDAWC